MNDFRVNWINMQVKVNHQYIADEKLAGRGLDVKETLDSIFLPPPNLLGRIVRSSI